MSLANLMKACASRPISSGLTNMGALYSWYGVVTAVYVGGWFRPLARLPTGVITESVVVTNRLTTETRSVIRGVAVA